MNIPPTKLSFQDVINVYGVLMEKIQKKYDEVAKARDWTCDRCAACCELTTGIIKPIEAVYLKLGFWALPADRQKLILNNCIQFKKEVVKRGYPTLPEIFFPREREFYTKELGGIACPLLEGENICMLYQCRPIGCRVFQCFSTGGQSKWNNLIGKISSLEYLYYEDTDFIRRFKNKYIADVLLDTLRRVTIKPYSKRIPADVWNYPGGGIRDGNRVAFSIDTKTEAGLLETMVFLLPGMMKGYNWYHIRLPGDGRDGWVMDTYVTK